MRELRIDAGGCTLAVDSHDDVSDGTPYLLLHGWLRNRYSWRDHVGAIAAHAPVYVADLPGFGASDVPDAAYDVPFFAGHVRALINALDLPKVRIVAHGLGGAIALRLALDEPDRVERMVLASPSWTKNPMVGYRARYVTTGPLGRFAFRAGLTRDRVRFLLLSRHFHEPIRVDDALVDSVWEPLRRRGAKEAALRSLRTDLDPGLTDAVPALTTPTAAVWGYNDRVHPLDLGKQLADATKAVSLKMIPNCGHVPHETRPRSFATYLAAHMDLPLDLEAIEDGHPKPGTASFA